MKTIVLFLFLFFTVQVSEAQKCKFDKDKTDNFSGERLRLSDSRIGQRTYNWKIRLEKNGSNYRVGMEIRWGLHIGTGIDQGTAFLTMKLANGQIIKVEADQFYAATHFGVQGAAAVISVFQPYGVVDQETIKMLSESPIVALKCNYGGVEQELPKIKEDQTEEVMRYAKCLLAD